MSGPLTRITTATEAAAWLGGLNDWYQDHGGLVRTRIYRNGTAVVPGWVRAPQGWWFVHDRLSKAYRPLGRLSRAGTLFTYLRAEHAGLNIAPTTNRIEGGTNAQLRLILRAHRGMSEEHQKRAIEWFLYLHSENQLPPADLIAAHHCELPRPKRTVITDSTPGPERYSTGLTAREGLWTRKGWAGRT